jgi:ubiquinone/menaquinone biosynthesis C-methylase UbiE
MAIKKTVADYWDIRSESYHGAASSSAEEDGVWTGSLDTLINDKPVRSVKAVLDVGTGSGFLARKLSGMGLSVTGVDISRGMLSQARKFKGGDIHDLCQGDAENLPIKSGSFDLVISRHLIWTLPDPQKAVQEWVRVLKDGGRIMAIDGNWFDPSCIMGLRRAVSGAISAIAGKRNPAPFGQFYGPLKQDLPLYSKITPDEFISLFRRAGLENVAVDRLGDVNAFYKKNSFLDYRIAYNPVFLVYGEKSQLRG